MLVSDIIDCQPGAVWAASNLQLGTDWADPMLILGCGWCAVLCCAVLCYLQVCTADLQECAEAYACRQCWSAAAVAVCSVTGRCWGCQLCQTASGEVCWLHRRRSLVTLCSPV